MPDSVRVRYPLSLIVFPKPESNSFPKLRLVDFYSHHATPPPRSSPVREYTPLILVRQENKHSRIHTATRSPTDLPHSLQGREGGRKIEAVAPGRCGCLAQRWVHSASRCRLCVHSASYYEAPSDSHPSKLWMALEHCTLALSFGLNNKMLQT